MRFAEIFEAPIGNLEVHNMDQPGTFPASDRRLMQSPQHIEKIRKHFQYTDNDFDLYFINRPARAYTQPTGYSDGKEFTKEWSDDIESLAGFATPEQVYNATGVAITPNPHAITVVFLSNANVQGTVSMTPWIIAHRFGHAITDQREKLPSRMKHWLNQIPSRFAVVAKWDTTNLYFKDVLTMRSARTGTLNDGEEIEELIAQFLLKGDVNLAVPDDTQVDAVGINSLNLQINQVRVKLENALQQVIDGCVGSLLIAV